MPHRPFFVVTVCAVFAIALAGCINDPVYPETELTVSVMGLPRLHDTSLYYELWLSYPPAGNTIKNDRVDHENAEYVGAGRFRIDAAGNVVDGAGPVRFALPSGYNASLVVDALVTLERRDAPSASPDRIVLGGPIIEGTAGREATLTMADGEAFGEKLLIDSGASLVLQAPTSTDPADSVSGVWFIAYRPSSTVPGGRDVVPGLRIAPQPLNPDNAKWTYESWLSHTDASGTTYRSMGRFRTPSTADAGGAGPGAGSNPAGAHAAPGEDFTGPSRLALNDGTYGVVVSIEPSDITLSEPFAPVFALDRIPAAAQSNTLMFLVPQSSFPKVVVTIAK